MYYSADTLGIPDVGLLLLKVLAVAGGAALGALTTSGLLRFLARRFTRKPVPRRALLALRCLGGFAGGLLVWLWVFSSGGQGGFGGTGAGWWPFGQGKGDVASPKAKPDTPPPPGRPEPVRIHILGGKRVVDQRFYILNQDAPRNAAEVMDALRRRQKLHPDFKDIEIVIYTDSVDRDNPAVTDLEKWARDNGLTPKLSLPDRTAP